jgi:hypothetical protein
MRSQWNLYVGLYLIKTFLNIGQVLSDLLEIATRAQWLGINHLRLFVISQKAHHTRSRAAWIYINKLVCIQSAGGKQQHVPFSVHPSIINYGQPALGSRFNSSHWSRSNESFNYATYMSLCTQINVKFEVLLSDLTFKWILSQRDVNGMALGV